MCNWEYRRIAFWKEPVPLKTNSLHLDKKTTGIGGLWFVHTFDQRNLDIRKPQAKLTCGEGSIYDYFKPSEANLIAYEVMFTIVSKIMIMASFQRLKFFPMVIISKRNMFVKCFFVFWIFNFEEEMISNTGGDLNVAKRMNAGTDAQKVRAQNNAAATGQENNVEFASETNAAEVRKQNQKSQANKS